MILDAIENQFYQLAIYAGSDNLRWKMKNLGWTGWAVKGIKEPKPETGFEKEE